MKSKFIEWLEAAAETMFSELFQAKALIVTFGALGLCLFDWRILEPVAIVICGNVRRNGIMWNFRI
nr:MAG: hypothetical protein [Bacteriophage sp.]